MKIHGIRQILDEMIYNITENAVKYNKENGNVTIWVGNTLEGPKVRVSDKESEFQKNIRIESLNDSTELIRAIRKNGVEQDLDCRS